MRRATVGALEWVWVVAILTTMAACLYLGGCTLQRATVATEVSLQRDVERVTSSLAALSSVSTVAVRDAGTAAVGALDATRTTLALVPWLVAFCAATSLLHGGLALHAHRTRHRP